ncbi:cation:proton antiporter [Hugenholtzia roseola]|uniref:cation:proton antiporter n=1 Tax=Hugenholtzia roseola TaxID=1002 RepID=UPI00047AFFFE|nr:cation:proton antiporter [Hugenholtzia roseola]
MHAATLLLNALDFSLPLKNPVLIFALILFIILFSPLLLNKLKIPHLIGLIMAGAVIGTHGLNLMSRDSSIVLFGTVGLLYIMFLAGLEIDLAEFKKNGRKSLFFGFLTFSLPMILGVGAGLYLLDFSLMTSVLLASMLASHTLIAYPLVSKLGVSKNRSVSITVAGTLITDTLSLLVLAVIVGMSAGQLTNEFWIRLVISVILFALIVMLGFPLIGRWFFKRFEDSISQYIFVLAMVFLGAFLAEAAGMEAIIGAFLAGLALNRLIPRTSPLMNRIEFVGNALFIPFFLIGVGMLIDYRAFFKDLETLKVASVMTFVALLSKFLAAFFTQKAFKFNKNELKLMFGLSAARAAATLAAVLIGYNIILGTDAAGQPIRLLNESVLNGTILMILITCTVASFLSQQGAQALALADAAADSEGKSESEERILIPIANLENAEELVNLSITVKSKRNKDGVFALNVINNTTGDSQAEKNAHKILDRATEVGAATDIKIQQLLRYDLNIVNAITSVIKEHKITDMIIGLHRKGNLSDSFLGTLTEGILTKCNTTTLIYKPHQPLATINRHIILIPEKAEREIGFPFWLIKLWNIGRNTGAKLVFYATENTIFYLKEIQAQNPIDLEFHIFDDWEDFLIISREVKVNDNLMVVMSRKNHPSYTPQMNKIPSYLNKYFNHNNFTLIYPIQAGVMAESYMNLKNPPILEPLQENLNRLDEFGKNLGKYFSKNK